MSREASVSMLDLFRLEAETETQAISSALLVLERDHTAADELDRCMRAAHSLKGAARIVGVDVGVRVAHSLEDCFVAAQHGRATLGPPQITALLAGTDLLMRIANTPEPDLASWVDEHASELDLCLTALDTIAAAPDPAAPGHSGEQTIAPAPTRPSSTEKPVASRPADGAWVGRDNSDRVLRVTTDNLNRLLGLAGESLVESRWLKPFGASLLRLKRLQHDVGNELEDLCEPLAAAGVLDESTQAALTRVHHLVAECQRTLSERLAELEAFDRRSVGLSHRLHHEALACRMRPFADGVQAFPRMVRDLGQSLGKMVRLDIIGDSVQVDRDILANLDAPLGHLLRNAVDHGIELPDRRQAAGKPAEGVIRLEARHSAGLLQIIVADDGSGVDFETIRGAVIERGLINRESAAKLTSSELLEFLFLPGFTMKEVVSEISGRGVGLDVVQDMVKRVNGTVRATAQTGKGTQFQLSLPVTLSVVRTLLAEIGGEPYAFPLAGIVRTLKLGRDKIAHLEGRQHFDFDGRPVGLVQGHQALGLASVAPVADELAVIVFGDQGQPYGLVVDRFLGERELAVRPIDRQLGKIKDIASAALTEDGAPVLIVDVQDLIHTMDRLASVGRLSRVANGTAVADQKKTKRVLVVDDSLTVRELERKLLSSRGYEVEVALDGMDGWNAVRAGRFDLVVTDVDMPRMDGIELLTHIAEDQRLKTLPVMVVSYKDRDEDRRRGLESGAAYYLTKGSFHDDTFLQAVVDLIGEADA